MMAKVQCPVLQHPCKFIMRFEHSDLKRIESFPIHRLNDSNILQIFYNLDVPICSCVMQKPVIAVVPLIVATDVVEKIKKRFVLVVSNGSHQRSTSIVIRLWTIAFVE